MQRPEVVGLVLSSLTGVLAELAPGGAAPTEATPLLGEGSDLDSLGLVMFVVEVEQRLRKNGMDVKLADALVLPHGENPFVTVATLADHLAQELKRPA